MTKFDHNKELPIIGWREKLALPELGIKDIRAKIDTGARTSALHAFNIENYFDNGQEMIKFKIHPLHKDAHKTIETRAKLVEYRQVKNSGGHIQLRPVIQTKIQLSIYTWSIELTLTNRDVMGFRMLLGRQAFKNRFLVDVGKSFLHHG